MKITILGHDLSNNSLARVYVLAKVLSRKHTVQIIGPVFGDGIWTPCQTGEFSFIQVVGKKYPFFLAEAKKIIDKIEGDLVYAVTPQPSSYGVGLINKIIHQTPLILDIDDWQVGFYLHQSRLSRFCNSLRHILYPNAYPYLLLMERLTKYANQVTSVSNFLQKKFGGIKLPQGRDTDFCNPERFNKEALKEERQLSNYRLVMFLGTPRSQKGLEETLEAIIRLKRNDVKLMIIGVTKDNTFINHLAQKGKDKLLLFGMCSFNDIPKYLSMADIVVLPQRETSWTIGQVPSKFFDAMAMAKPIISTKVSEIPEILAGCGLVVDTNDIEALSKSISYLLENEEEAIRLGKKAREKCIQEYSFNALEKIIDQMFKNMGLEN
ncbi:glycosyltransferase [bacterium]|nr:glycosyltransferase [bacterium]MBU0899720.1 glycosyltransferase [bacterium]MBU1153071.1 glycosyltransferase [bacterium]MBU1782441.1 glycosyltransferase [bacterium]MBU2599876.1 glycosyltransferase [bacterium]